MDTRFLLKSRFTRVWCGDGGNEGIYEGSQMVLSFWMLRQLGYRPTDAIHWSDSRIAHVIEQARAS